MSPVVSAGAAPVDCWFGGGRRARKLPRRLRSPLGYAPACRLCCCRIGLVAAASTEAAPSVSLCCPGGFLWQGHRTSGAHGARPGRTRTAGRALFECDGDCGLRPCPPWHVSVAARRLPIDRTPTGARCAGSATFWLRPSRPLHALAHSCPVTFARVFSRVGR